MNYNQTLDYLYSHLPMFSRIGKAAFKKDLGNTIRLCEALGNPEKNFKSIHIAGTNGKGSCSHMIASILQESGLKTGLYTSPHLKDFRERIRINGVMIPEAYVTAFVEKYQEIFERIEPSFFEWSVALCFDYFAHQKVDIAVIETGLGGRFDSTNVITPVLSVITNIGYDHTDMLGETLPEIAFEKAGIIKPNIPVVIGEKLPETASVFSEKAQSSGSKITFASDQFKAVFFKSNHTSSVCDIEEQGNLRYKNMECDLGGLYQQKNIITVIAAIDQLIANGYSIDETNIREGLREVKSNTGLMGRWQVLSEKPFTVCDTGHNAEGLAYVVEQIKACEYKTLRIVFGVVRDKDLSRILPLLPKDAHYYFCKADLPRALDEKELQSRAVSYGLYGETYPSVKEALSAARAEASEEDMIFIGGSTFVVAEAV